MSYIITDWTECYNDSWKGLIVDPAMAHPAKFARGLITRIIKYALEQGYVEPGSTVVDPFGGVALGALPAMQYGLEWVGCELEEKFVKLGRENIALWNSRFSSMPKWSGKAVLLQGDSRKLASVIKAAGLVVSSPPYGDSLNTKDEGDDRVRENYPGWHSTGKAGYQRDYGQTPGQLAALPAGPPPVVVGSPPYVESIGKGNSSGEYTGMTHRDSPGGDFGQSLKAMSGEAYGQTPGQLAALPAGAAPLPPCPPALISSPPFAGNSGGRGEASRNGIDAALFDRHSGGMIGGMGDEPGNLGNLPMGQPVVVGSPPYSEAQTGGTDIYNKLEITHNRKLTERSRTAGYRADLQGQTPGQLAALPAGAAPLVVASPPYATGEKGHPSLGSVNKDDWGNDGRDIAGRRGLDGDYGSTPGQLGVMVAGSPPFENSLSSEKNGIDWTKTKKDYPGRVMHDERIANMERHHNERRYSDSSDNLGSESGETFWSAAALIVQQCAAILPPGAYAFWVVKSYVKNGAIVDFPAQWQALCEATGFETVEVIRAWLVKKNGAQAGLDGQMVSKDVARKSFFRRLHESKQKAKKHWGTLGRKDKATALWVTRGLLWAEYRLRLANFQALSDEEKEDDLHGEPSPPTRGKILSSAQTAAWSSVGEPDYEIETAIDYETVLVMRRTDNQLPLFKAA